MEYQKYAQMENPEKVLGPSGEILTYEEWLEWKDS